MRVTLWLSLVSLLLATGCFGSKYYQVRGTIVDCATDAPVENAVVRVSVPGSEDPADENSALTDSAGLFRVFVNECPSPEAEVSVSVVRDGYERAERTAVSDRERDQGLCLKSVEAGE